VDPLKKKVGIRIQCAGETEKKVWFVEGEAFFKGETVYLRYPEPEMGRTWTTLKLKQGYFRLVRHGDVRSEMDFILSQKAAGYYQVAEGRMPLETYTVAMSLCMSPQGGTVSWRYNLFMMDQEAGSFSIRLDLEPVGPNLSPA
jgi:uncharacterized beta-barrel protein YwiB (DUF1934 family)